MNVLTNFKKITSLLLILTVVFAFSYSTVIFAAEPYEFKLVADFSDGTLNGVLDSTVDNVELDTEVTFGTGKSTVKWSLESEPFIAPLIHNFRDEIKQDFIDAGGNRTKSLVTLRFYSDAEGAVVTLHPCNESGKDTHSTDERVTTYSFTVGSTGWQEASVPFQSYMYSNIETYGLLFIPESGSGDIWFDSVWFERVPYSTVPTTELVSVSVENNATFVPAELDGSNTLTYSFKENIGDFAENAVEVYEIVGGEEVLTSQSYSLSSDGKNLNVTFDSPLTSPMSYRMILKSGLVEDERGRALGEENNIVFSVGKGSPYFTAEPSLENAAEVEAQSDFEYEIKLSSDFSDENLEDYVTVYKNSEKLRSGVTVAKDGTILRVLFDKTEPGCTYHVALDESFADSYGTALSGETIFSFSTVDGEISAADMHLYSASSGKAPTPAGGSTSMVTENTHFYSQTAKLSYVAGTNARYDLTNLDPDISEMNYMNCWIYSPEASGETMFYFIGIPGDPKQTTYYTGFNLNWTGWKLVSAPFTDFGNMLNDSFFGPTVQIRVGFNLGATVTKNDGYILIDDAWFSAEPVAEPEVINSSIDDKTSDVSVFNTCIDFELNALLESDPKVTVTDNHGNEFKDFTTELDNKNLTVSFGTLSPLTTYTVKVSGAKSAAPALLDMKPYEMSFTTSGEGIEVKGIEFNQDKLKTSQDVIAEYDLSNTTGNSLDVTLHLVAYNDDGYCVGVKTLKKASASDISDTLTITSAELQGASSVKAFATIGEDMLVSDYYAFLGELGSNENIASNTASVDEKIVVEFKSVELKSADLTANVLLSGVKNIALVSIFDSDGTLVKYEPISVNGNEFEYSYTFADDFKNSVITLSVTSGGKSAKYEILYVSSADREKFVNLANGTDKKKLHDFIADNTKVLGLSNASDELLEDIAMVVIEGETYADYDSVVEAVSSINSVYEGLNKLVWSELADFVIKNNKILLNNNEYYDDFKSSSKENKNVYAQNMFKEFPVDSISDFRTLFTDVMEAGLDNGQSGGGTGGGTGSGKGGSKSTTVAIVPPVNQITPTAPDNSAVVFNDLAAFSWAEESILMLHSKGVVSSDAGKKFRPADSITREEFVKLLVSFMYGNVSEVAHSFNDSVSGAWYEPYLSKAFETGLVTGRPDGSFGIGENITREDMAVIVHRALDISGKTLSAGSSAAFADESSISDYALDAVNALSAVSVINGVGENTFAPKDNANRAQAAVIVARLYNLN